jgi:hypothetical protein
MTGPHDNDNIDDFFRDFLQSGEKVPPTPVWDQIEGELNRDRRRKFLFWWTPRVATAILALFVAVLLLLSQRHEVGPASGRRNDGMPAAVGKGRTPISNTDLSRISDRDESTIVKTRPSIHLPLPAVSVLSTVVSPDRAAGYQRPVLPGIESVLKRDQPGILPGRMKTDRPAGPFIRSGAVRLTPFRSRFDLTAYLSQELAGYSLADHDSTGPHGREIEKRESTSFSTSVGVLISYQPKPHWVIQTGLGLSRSISVGNPGKAVAVKDNNGNISYQINTVTGYGYLASPGTNIGDSVTTGKVTGKLDYISIPVVLARSWTFKRFSLLAGAGFSMNFLTRATMQASLASPSGTGQEKEVTQYGLRNFNYGFQLKVESRYQISQAYAIDLMITFKNSVGPVNSHTSYSTYPYNMGVGLGITRSF